MSKLIAMVATAVMVDGVRTVIQPGEELPELSKHDATELVASGAAEDSTATAEAKKDEAKATSDAAAEFEKARQRVKDEQASTAVVEKKETNPASVAPVLAKTDTAAPAPAPAPAPASAKPAAKTSKSK